MSMSLSFVITVRAAVNMHIRLLATSSTVELTIHDYKGFGGQESTDAVRMVTGSRIMLVSTKSQ